MRKVNTPARENTLWYIKLCLPSQQGSALKWNNLLRRQSSLPFHRGFVYIKTEQAVKKVTALCKTWRKAYQAYSKIPLLRPPKIRTFYLFKILFWKFKLFFSSFTTPSVHLIRDHLWTVQKWSLRPLLDSLQGGLNIGILLYLFLLICFHYHCVNIAIQNLSQTPEKAKIYSWFEENVSYCYVIIYGGYSLNSHLWQTKRQYM